MSRIGKILVAAALSLSATVTMAHPVYLVTHNRTDVESNAYIAGVPSTMPTPAHADKKIHWAFVNILCFKHLTADRKCLAEIKMATNTAAPISLGTVSLDIDSGEITPKSLSANGYTLTVNGPGETTLTRG